MQQREASIHAHSPALHADPDATDMRASGWIARMPAASRPYLLLARLDRPVGIWLLFLPGAWGILLGGATASGTIRLLLLFAIGSVVMRSAGCVVNDMWDRDLDRMVRRTAQRPLASGMIRLRQAAVFLALLLLAGLAVLMQLDRMAQALGAGSLLLVALYPLAKRVTWWPQLVMGFTFGVGAPVGYVAASGLPHAAGYLTEASLIACAALYAAAIAWDLGFDTIYGFQDMEDDALIGVKSTSRLFAGHPRAFVGACYAGTVLLLAVAGRQAGLGAGFWLGLPLPAAALALQVKRLSIHDPASCLAVFKSNREAGLLVAACLLAGRI